MTRPEKPAVPSTPRDVVHIRAGSFLLVFAIALAALSLVAGLPWLTIVAAVIVIATITDMVIAVRRQRSHEREGNGSAGLE
jgi:Flp pilus assembly protein TadB